VLDVEEGMTKEEKLLFLRIANLATDLVFTKYLEPKEAFTTAIERLDVKVITR